MPVHAGLEAVISDDLRRLDRCRSECSCRSVALGITFQRESPSVPAGRCSRIAAEDQFGTNSSSACQHEQLGVPSDGPARVSPAAALVGTALDDRSAAVHRCEVVDCLGREQHRCIALTPRFQALLHVSRSVGCCINAPRLVHERTV